jgi:hypothetical protein
MIRLLDNQSAEETKSAYWIGKPKRHEVNAGFKHNPTIGSVSGPESTCVKRRTNAARYLRAAHAYMLISMPTGTSTIFGAFQAIWLSF